MKKQRAMRRAPSEQCDYVFEGSAADCYIEIYRIDKVKNQIYRGVAQLVARLLWEQDAGSSSLPTPTKDISSAKGEDMSFFLVQICGILNARLFILVWEIINHV